jgi:hypothetical protein
MGRIIPYIPENKKLFETTNQPFAENPQHMRLSEIMVDSKPSSGQPRLGYLGSDLDDAGPSAI